MSIASSTVRNGLSHFFGVAINITTSFVVTPIVIHGVGITEFGIWAIANSLVGYASLLDLGLSQTLIKKVSEALARGETDRANYTIGLVLTIHSCLGLLSMALFAIIGLFAPLLFNVPPSLHATLREVVLIVGFVSAFGFPMSVLSGVVGALQDFYVSNIVAAVLNVVRAAATFAIIGAGHGLVALVILGAVLSFLGWFIAWLWIRRRAPDLRIRFRALKGDALLGTMRFSGSMFLWSFAGQAVQFFDKMVIGMLLPVRSVGLYEVGSRLNAYSRFAVNVVFVAMPAASGLFAQGRYQALRMFYLRGTKLVLGLYTLIASGVLILGDDFIRLWVGDGFATSATIAQMLVVGTLFQSQNSMGHVILVGMGRLRIFTRVMAAYPIMLAVTCVCLGYTLGEIGVAAGVTSTIIVLEFIIMLHLLTVMEVRFWAMIRHVHAPIAGCAIVSGSLAWLLAWIRPPSGWSDLAIDAAVLASIYTLTFMVFGLSRDERAELMGRLRIR